MKAKMDDGTEKRLLICSEFRWCDRHCDHGEVHTENEACDSVKDGEECSGQMLHRKCVKPNITTVMMGIDMLDSRMRSIERSLKRIEDKIQQ